MMGLSAAGRRITSGATTGSILSGAGVGKIPWFKQRSAVYEIRAAWCDWTNYTMERAGHEARHPPEQSVQAGD